MTVQRDWGDRSNRKHARLKYTIEDRGLDGIPRRGREARGRDARRTASRSRSPPPATATAGPRARTARHHLTLFIENGRIQDEAGGADADRPAPDRRDARRRFPADRRTRTSSSPTSARKSAPTIEALVAEHGLIAAGVGPAAQLHGLRRAADLRARARRERALSARPHHRAGRAALARTALPRTTSSSA